MFLPVLSTTIIAFVIVQNVLASSSQQGVYPDPEGPLSLRGVEPFGSDESPSQKIQVDDGIWQMALDAVEQSNGKEDSDYKLIKILTAEKKADVTRDGEPCTLYGLRLLLSDASEPTARYACEVQVVKSVSLTRADFLNCEDPQDVELEENGQKIELELT